MIQTIRIYSDSPSVNLVNFLNNALLESKSTIKQLALLKAQASLQLEKVFSSDNEVSVSIMYLYMYCLFKQHTAVR